MRALSQLAQLVHRACRQVPEGGIDVGFARLEVEPVDREQVTELLKEALDGQGEFANMHRAEFLGGPSYIATGAWIGDQGVAFCLYAVLASLDLGDVITPAAVGITDEAKAKDLMGRGFVMFAPNRTLRDTLAAD